MAGAHLVNTQVLVLWQIQSIAEQAVQGRSLEEKVEEKGPENLLCLRPWQLCFKLEKTILPLAAGHVRNH